ARIGEKRHSLRNEIEDVLLFLGVGAADGERDDLRTRILDRRFDKAKGIFARAQNKARTEFPSADHKCIFHIVTPSREKFQLYVRFTREDAQNGERLMRGTEHDA